VDDFSGAIGVFDSGVGGLSVLKAISRALPNRQLVYLADSANAPYGDRSDDFIQDRVMAMAKWLTDRQVSAIVVACNTATSVAVNQLRAAVSIPVIAIEPPIKPACQLSKNTRIGVMATTRTVASNNVKELIERYGVGRQVFLQACPGLVTQIETGQIDCAQTRALLSQYLAPLIEKQIDTLVLGCTHYPFLKDQIQALVGADVTILEPADAVARELARRLINQVTRHKTERFFSNTDLVVATKVMSLLWGAAVSVEPFSA
jgi:glutamate racemase